MIPQNDRLTVYIGYLQSVCKLNNVSFTGHERREELEGLLKTANVNFNPNVSAGSTVYSAVGTTSSPSTTNNFTGTAFVLVDPVISVSLKKNQTAVVRADVSVGGTSGVRMITLVYSTNGGTSWTNLGSWLNQTVPSGQIVPCSLTYSYKASNDVNIVFGIRIANADGTSTVIAQNNQRQMTVTVG